MPVYKSYILDSLPYKGGSTKKDAAVREGKTIYKMSSNENPLGPSPKAVAAIQNCLAGISEYQFQDDKLFTEKLSGFFEGRLQPQQFLPANSGMELLDLICRAFLEPGDSCILSSPTFMAYKNFAELCGARAIDVPLINDCFALDIFGILAAIDSSTRLIFVANPNNPTGSFFPKAEMDELVEGLPDHVVLVYDEAYYQYVGCPDYPRAEDYIESGKNVIGLHSFSKACGLAGLRLGYIFSTPEISGYLRHLRRPFMVNSLSMEAGMAALGDWEHLSRTLSNNLAEKSWLYDELDRLGMQYWKTEANFILIRPDCEAEWFARRMLEAGVMLRTTAVMGAPGCLRVTIGTRVMNEAFVQAVAKLNSSQKNNF